MSGDIKYIVTGFNFTAVGIKVSYNDFHMPAFYSGPMLNNGKMQPRVANGNLGSEMYLHNHDHSTR